ncbi:MAG: response regulator [Phototrophicaceae bacterium]
MALPKIFEGQTILLVDDEPDNLKLAKIILSASGGVIVTAENGQEALDLLSTLHHPPAFILLDLSMPKLDGWQCLIHLKAHPVWASIPTIAFTAHAMMGDEDKVMQHGFNGYISKPIKAQTFVKQILDILDIIR